MQKVLTAAEMREVDRLTVERFGIPSILLMENAAQAVVRVIEDKLGGSVRGKSILVLCGKGNNGGDGAAVARMLAAKGAAVSAFLVGRVADAAGDARTNFDTATKLASLEPASRGYLYFEEVGSIDHWVHTTGFEIEKFDLVVDALFGTGLTRKLDAEYKYIVDVCTTSHLKRPVPVVAVDMPSGLNADDAAEPEIAFRADTTVTFTAPKLANVMPTALALNGDLIVADIGSPKELVDAQPSKLFVAEDTDVRAWLDKTKFTSASYKNKRGHCLIIAGSKNYTGAAVLCGNAAIRSGVGLTTLGVPESSSDSVVGRVVPEVMVRGISETKNGSASAKAAAEIDEFLENIDAVALGSGLSSKEDETKEFIRQVVENRRTPVVIDADGLTALSPFAIQGSDELPLILTPHEGEFSKLLGVEKSEMPNVLNDRPGAVRAFALQHNVILVLKGERVLIGAPDGRVVINPVGNSGLGKAGNGDTLTGVITGFVAQAVQMEIDIFESVVAAVYVSSMAGDLAAEKYGKRVMTASDVKDCLGEVFRGFEGT